jgi:ATP-dependent Clp protease adaptor protein ClpS
MSFTKDPDSLLIEEISEETVIKKPKRYFVILINDDYTPMEFVVYVLQRVFYKNQDQARVIMLEAHNKGKAVCGIYSQDVAKTKVSQVQTLAEEGQHPLRCEIEAAEEES